MEKKQEQIAKVKENSLLSYDLIIKPHGHSTVIVRCCIDQSLYNIIEKLVEEYSKKRWLDEE